MTSLPIVKPEEIKLDNERLQQAGSLLKEWTAAGSVPGAAIVVGRYGMMVEPQFFGKQGPEKNAKAIRSDGMFLLASITKPIVYMSALRLVERGELVLSLPVTHYIPDFAAHHKESMLVHHLFTHTSGMPDMLENNVALRQSLAPLKQFIHGAIYDTVPLFQPAGTGLSYQSMGTLILAEIIQRLTRKTIAQHVRDEIIKPLGLQNTWLGRGEFPRERLVRVETPEYQTDSNFGWNSPYWQDLGVPWGGMFSSPADMAVICQCMLNYGEVADRRLLSRSMLEMATTNRLNDYPDLPEPIRRSQPWGLGWRLNHPGQSGSWGNLLDRSVFGHTGATGTMVWMDRRRNGFAVLLTTAIRSQAPWRLVKLSNMIASAFY
ncbi:serine hydrolase domain-containing protein [Gimesia maris]|uniref:Esterase EstB n=1 Tax=Gimesia maris TaxID=122 RepID=A0ABX5YJ86_9PLAN|nr:serine hydrolase domain-containing protein [Gimesia maris]EDL59923.1 putative beta-lactamase [Gimesia maris DSM 8797]QEG15679.1 Esterase EstB [Gimesia maris]QGQ31038.1 beta-lactamase family protein [Gimesia maris]